MHDLAALLGRQIPGRPADQRRASRARRTRRLPWPRPDPLGSTSSTTSPASNSPSAPVMPAASSDLRRRTTAAPRPRPGAAARTRPPRSRARTGAPTAGCRSAANAVPTSAAPSARSAWSAAASSTGIPARRPIGRRPVWTPCRRCPVLRRRRCPRAHRPHRTRCRPRRSSSRRRVADRRRTERPHRTAGRARRRRPGGRPARPAGRCRRTGSRRWPRCRSRSPPAPRPTPAAGRTCAARCGSARAAHVVGGQQHLPDGQPVPTERPAYACASANWPTLAAACWVARSAAGAAGRAARDRPRSRRWTPAPPVCPRPAGRPARRPARRAARRRARPARWSGRTSRPSPRAVRAARDRLAGLRDHSSSSSPIVHG